MSKSKTYGLPLYWADIIPQWKFMNKTVSFDWDIPVFQYKPEVEIKLSKDSHDKVDAVVHTFRQVKHLPESKAAKRSRFADHDNPNMIEGRTLDRIMKNYEESMRDDQGRLVKSYDGWYVRPRKGGHGGLTRRQYAAAQIEWKRRLAEKTKETAAKEQAVVVLDIDWD